MDKYEEWLVSGHVFHKNSYICENTEKFCLLLKLSRVWKLMFHYIHNNLLNLAAQFSFQLFNLIETLNIKIQNIQHFVILKFNKIAKKSRYNKGLL